MRHSKRLPYGAVAVEENHSSSRSSSEFQDYTTIEFPEVDEQKPQPQLLKRSQLDRIFRLLWDMILAIVAFLFALFGILVSWMDGKPAGPESVGSKLFEVSRFVSFPCSDTRPPQLSSNLADILFPPEGTHCIPSSFCCYCREQHQKSRIVAHSNHRRSNDRASRAVPWQPDHYRSLSHSD
ncbi:hypothetical protein PDIG_48530 [Penicillium digitatum PHI26]|uniref:Uncharacterized protein n=2 Tax=Penicillium digitatum TaxID=36651 RepID=K9GEL3_PEND2|nr:hypothetical protein PDIP_57900 [Penicillium digitatum Pd1]EKV11001.1 hypothetical protein PDIP_57900 [Penicillium digitatum Pd1]EKV11721.1 hypothetical protein PDIG_48530 [Penicillium digitatum PHI26]